MANSVLTNDAVETVVRKVLYKPEELTDGQAPKDAITVDGLVRKFGFHPGRVKEADAEIRALLKELPDNFMKEKGGGWSFVNACFDRENRQWTGDQRVVEALVCLGIAAGAASWQLKDIAKSLPGGVPYFEVHP